MDDIFIGLVGLFIAAVLLVGPIVAVFAFVAIRRQRRSQEAIESRLEAVERQLEDRPVGVAAAQVVTPAVAPREPSEERGIGVEIGQPDDVTAPMDETAGVPPTAVPAATAAPSAPAPARRLDLETLIAGRWLNRIGVLAVLLAAAFFLRFAFENQWVGALGRVVIGLLCGTALLGASQWLLGRGMRYFSEGIAGLGAGVLFLSLYAAWAFYELIPEFAALGGMVAVTGALATLALGRDSQRLATLALSGGMATPSLLESGAEQYVALFSYLGVLVGCFLILAWGRAWRWVAPPAFVGVALYWAWFQIEHYDSDDLWSVVLVTTLLFAMFAIYFVGRSRGIGEQALRLPELLLALANSAAYGVALQLLLYEDHRWLLTGAVLVLGLLHVVAARAVPLGGELATRGARFVFAGVALSFATAAIPIRLEGQSIVSALSMEAAVLVWAGFRSEIRALRLTGAGLLGVVLMLLFAQSGQRPEPAFFNERFAAFGVAFAAFVACLVWARPHLGEIGRERLVYGVLGVGATLVAVWGLSEEVWRFLGHQQGWALEPRLARQMGLSLLWAVAAGLLIWIGVHQRSRVWRWQGLTLLAVVIVKVFTLDLSFLERAYRIASLLVLGLVLLAVSFAYQRAFGTGEDGQGKEGEGNGT